MPWAGWVARCGLWVLEILADDFCLPYYSRVCVCVWVCVCVSVCVFMCVCIGEMLNTLLSGFRMYMYVYVYVCSNTGESLFPIPAFDYIATL